jgi:hypothetical protein
VQVQNKGKLKNLVVGDYQAQFGQGLVLGGAFGLGKGGEAVTTARRSNVGLIPYTSVLETGMFRGVGATYQLTPSLFVTSFLSSVFKDASISVDSSDQSSISSLPITGLHRNEIELRNRKAIRETNFGYILNYKRRSVDAGLIFNRAVFSLPIERNHSPYNQFTYRGEENNNTSLFINYSIANTTFFSEVAHTWAHGLAVNVGLLSNLTQRLELAMVFRKYDRDFYSFYSNAFAENSVAQNEQGIYWGANYRIAKKYSFSGYVDLFEFPWLRYRSYSPSSGFEYLLRFNYQPSKTIHAFVQFREEQKQRNTSADTPLYLTESGRKRNWWLNVDYQISSSLRFKTRAQFSNYQFENKFSKGMTLLQDISWTLNSFEFTARYALFDTDDFENRQYVFERDVWLAYSLPAYFGQGIRYLFLIQFNVNQRLTFWLRWTQTRYQNQDSIGSGLDAINGNQRNDIKCQIRLRL